MECRRRGKNNPKHQSRAEMKTTEPHQPPERKNVAVTSRAPGWTALAWVAAWGFALYLSAA